MAMRELQSTLKLATDSTGLVVSNTVSQNILFSYTVGTFLFGVLAALHTEKHFISIATWPSLISSSPLLYHTSSSDKFTTHPSFLNQPQS